MRIRSGHKKLHIVSITFEVYMSTLLVNLVMETCGQFLTHWRIEKKLNSLELQLSHCIKIWGKPLSLHTVVHQLSKPNVDYLNADYLNSTTECSIKVFDITYMIITVVDHNFVNKSMGFAYHNFVMEVAQRCS